MCITIIHSGTRINPLKNNRNLYLIKIWAKAYIIEKAREKSLLILKQINMKLDRKYTCRVYLSSHMYKYLQSEPVLV